jgi:hypothetical protein
MKPSIVITTLALAACGSRPPTAIIEEPPDRLAAAGTGLLLERRAAGQLANHHGVGAHALTRIVSSTSQTPPAPTR